MTKKIIFILSIPIILLLFFVSIFTISIYQPQYFFQDQLLSLNSDKKIYRLDKFDLFNPKYTIIQPNTTDYNSKDGTTERGLTITSLKRKNILFWERGDDYADGKFSATYSVNEMLQMTKQFDLVNKNKDPDNIMLIKSNTNSNQQSQPTDSSTSMRDMSQEDQYFERISNNQKKDRNLVYFNKLKKGMNYKEVYTLTDYGDRGMEGIFSKQPENNYLVDKDNINFVTLIYDKAPNFSPDVDVILQKLSIVRKDRTIIEVPAKPDGTFDFDSIKDKLK